MYKRGDYVKVEFTDGIAGENEWMWIRVDDSDDDVRLVFGRLDSQPVVHTDLRMGQELAVSYDKVREHRQFPQL